MTLHTLRELLERAESGGYAVGAFNVSSLDQAIAVLDAAEAERSPVIVQSIAGMSAYDDEARWWARLRRLIDDYPTVPVALHLDHGRSYDDCARAIEAGFSSVMIDASRDPATDEPSTFEANVALTSRVVALAHPRGVSVEGELGTIGGALAVAVGTSHGSVKFTDAEGGQRLRIPLIAQIKERLPQTFLVLHGSSSVPSEAVATINAHGGRVRPSYGISPEQKGDAISTGIRKINQGTDSHLAWTAALRELLSTRPDLVEPGEQLGVALIAFRDMVARRMREFGSAGAA